MNINNSTQKTMQSTQMDYEISSPPLYPYTIYTTQFLLYTSKAWMEVSGLTVAGWSDHSLCCCCILYWSWCHMLRVLAPPLDTSLTAGWGHWWLVTPCAAGCQCAGGAGAAQSSEAAAGWLERLLSTAATRTRQPCHSRPCPCSLHHHHTSPSTPSHQQKTSTNIFWGQIFLGLSLKLIWNSHNKDF